MSRRITHTACGFTLAVAGLLTSANHASAQVFLPDPCCPTPVYVYRGPVYYPAPVVVRPAPVTVVSRPVYALPIVTYAPPVTYVAPAAPVYVYRDPWYVVPSRAVRYKYEVDTPWGEYEYRYRADRRGIRIREDWDD